MNPISQAGVSPMGGKVPLSEHEQRQLEQIEQALYAEHPRFAKAVRAADPQVHYRRRIVYAALGFVAGIALLIVGVAMQIWVSIVGFVVMLASSYWAYLSYRRMNGIATGRIAVKEARGRDSGPGGKAARGKRGGKRSGGLGNRLEERWRRRQEEEGR